MRDYIDASQKHFTVTKVAQTRCRVKRWQTQCW